MTSIAILGATGNLGRHVAGHDVFVSCAGVVTEGEAFVRLVDGIVTALESLGSDKPPVCWLLAGAALLPLYAMRVPQMIIPYADAASVMLAHVGPGDSMSRHRVGVALPVGMKGSKSQWAAQPRKAG